jgi:hypothetical protein
MIRLGEARFGMAKRLHQSRHTNVHRKYGMKDLDPPEPKR